MMASTIDIKDALLDSTQASPFELCRIGDKVSVFLSPLARWEPPSMSFSPDQPYGHMTKAEAQARHEALASRS